MNANEALEYIDPVAWSKTSIVERLALIKQVQDNLRAFAKELGETDAKMKNDLIGAEGVDYTEGMGTTVNPMANTLLGCKRFYESMVLGEMPKPNGIKQIDDATYEVEVFPIHRMDKIVAGKQKGYLHVTGEPKQMNPLDKPAGVIAILGAGNYSSSIEMAMALFLESKAVIHKPHHNNVATDEIWEKVFAPLIEIKALAFCDADQGKEISKIKSLDAIYFTGSTGVAHAIQDAAQAPLVSECGGNNPCIVVPGDRLWTEKELQHQAIQIASIGKLNGGAVCGRAQTIITSKNWPQREAFLVALRKAIREDTFACSTYYPNVDETKAAFLENQPTAEVLQPEGGKHPAGDFVFIPGVGTDDFAVHNEAFCQIISEVPIDTENEPVDFLDKATDFCNNELLGSLGCMLLVDNDTFAAHEDRVHQAVHELRYGGIAVNSAPPSVWLNAYLTWSGNGETTKNFVSGVGNFGNGLNFENVVKSVIIDDFSSMPFSLTNRKQFKHLLENNSYFAINQSWVRFVKLVAQMGIDGLRKKDF